MNVVVLTSTGRGGRGMCLNECVGMRHNSNDASGKDNATPGD